MVRSEFLFKAFLSSSKYRVSKEMLQRFLSDSSNLVLSFTNTLDYFNKEYIAANVPKTALRQLPKSFIAQVSNGKTEHIVLVSKVSNNKIKIQLSETKSFIITENQFISDWTGFIIALEENKAIGKTTLSKEDITFRTLILSALILLSYVLLVTKEVFLSTYFALSLIGLGLSYLIIREKIGQQTFASKYCKISITTNCKNVLNSKKAKVFKDLDLSDIVVIYFTFICFAFLLQPKSILFFMTSLVSLPIIIYSLYEQYFSIKKWCPLCLGIASILVLQFFTLLPLYGTTVFRYSNILLFSSVLSITILCWLFIKPLLVLEQKSNTLEIENLSFRRNHKLFLPYYNSLNQIDTECDNIPQITLGAKNPKIKLTIITNPLCNSCVDAHKTYIEVLKKHEDSVQLNFRFLVPNKDRTDSKTIVSERLLQLYFENDTEVFVEAFNDWYAVTNIKEWTKKWRKCEEIKYSKILSQQVYWCLKQGIDSTPTVLINNRLFPENYSYKDIEHFIDPILEQEANKTERNIKNIHA